MCRDCAEKSGPRYPPWPQTVPLSIRPCFKKTCCPEMTSSAVKITAPAGSTNLSGIGGAFWYAFAVSRISTAKPAAMVARAATFHHEDNDSTGSLSASAIVPSLKHHIHLGDARRAYPPRQVAS